MAAVALDESVESEDIQAVGMRCREALLAFIRSVSNTNLGPAGEVKPQTSNFMEWSKLVANAIAPGSHNEHIRGDLKAVAKETWQLAGWLTHAVNASRHLRPLEAAEMSLLRAARARFATAISWTATPVRSTSVISSSFL
jgi:hypothetical protein